MIIQIDFEGQKGRKVPHGLILAYPDSMHESLIRHGISRETAEHFGAGLFEGPGPMGGRLVLPIHDGNGDLIAYVGRTLNSDPADYIYSPGFQPSTVLFNLHRAVSFCCDRPTAPEVVVVQDLFDCIRVHQAGFESVVALMGSSLSEAQERLIVENFSLVRILSTDRRAAGDLTRRLARTLFVRTVQFPRCRRSAQFSTDEIYAVLSDSFGIDFQRTPRRSRRSGFPDDQISVKQMTAIRPVGVLSISDASLAR